MNPRNAYREETVRGAHPVQLVVLLYEQMIEDLRQAVNAMEQNDIALRTNKINHAIAVIAYLESSLNKEAGGQVAMNLERFYHQLRGYLVLAQSRVSRAILSQQIMDLLSLREAWSEVERQVKSTEAAGANSRTISPVMNLSVPATRRLADWKG
ncbi:MAG: flagellar export chaperone FliS [Terriglobales bacterium]